MIKEGTELSISSFLAESIYELAIGLDEVNKLANHVHFVSSFPFCATTARKTV